MFCSGIVKIILHAGVQLVMVRLLKCCSWSSPKRVGLSSLCTGSVQQILCEKGDQEGFFLFLYHGKIHKK